MPCSREYFPGAKQVWVRGGKSTYLLWVKAPRNLVAEANLAAKLGRQRWRGNKIQVCSHKNFPGAEKVWVRSGKRNHLLYVKSPRDSTLEIQMAAESEQVRLRWEVVYAKKKKEKEEELLSLGVPAADLKALVRHALSRPGAQSLVTSGSSTTTLQGPVTNMSATAYQRFKLKREIHDADSNFDFSKFPKFENGENEMKPDISRSSPPPDNLSVPLSHRSPPHSPQRKRVKREHSPSTPSTASARKKRRRARESEIRRLSEEARLMRAEKKTLWSLVDVLQEQKEMMQGKIKALEWKVARGNKLLQGEGMDVLIEKLADTERELVRKLGAAGGVEVGDDGGAMIIF